MDAAERVAAVADDPSGRLALATEFYASAPAACRSYGRAQLAFMGWEISRGVLNPLDADQPGSPWWRAVNAGLLVDQVESIGPPDSGPGGLGVQRWRAFLSEPTPVNWYAAHNTSVVNGYLESAELATREAMSEQWFINLVLIRVLFAHASIADDRSVGNLVGELGAVLSQPTGRAISDAVHLNDFYPATYPIHPCHAWWAELAPSAWFERFVDKRFVLPHTTALFRSASTTLNFDDLALLAINDVPAYPWPLIQGGASPSPPRRTWLGRLLHHRSEPKPPAEHRPHAPSTPDYNPTSAAAALLKDSGDRPWPAPDRPWLAFQRWEHILFLHWPVPVDVVRPHVPDGLEIDTFDGSAWVALVPLKMADVHLRHLPQGGPISNFPELNLRTYVRYKGQPGVWFFSLDAPSRFDVWIGRHVFHLKYELARAKLATDSATEHHLTFRSVRDTGWEGAPEGAPAAAFEVTYQPKGTGAPPTPGTLEYFLCERYAMFTRDATGNYLMGEIHHRPWQIFTAEVALSENTVADACGLTVSGPPASALYSPVMENVVWPMVRV
jgi:uncharacterized protein YqjF (DUF2071 family)